MLRWLTGKSAVRLKADPHRADHGAVETRDPQSAYALWAATYPPRPHNALMEVEHETVLALVPDVRGLTVLDAGCGSGRYLHVLAGRGARAIGIDLSAAMLERA